MTGPFCSSGFTPANFPIFGMKTKRKMAPVPPRHSPPNGYPRHAPCLGSFLARHGSRHGQPSVIADVDMAADKSSGKSVPQAIFFEKSRRLY